MVCKLSLPIFNFFFVSFFLVSSYTHRLSLIGGVLTFFLSSSLSFFLSFVPVSIYTYTLSFISGLLALSFFLSFIYSFFNFSSVLYFFLISCYELYQQSRIFFPLVTRNLILSLSMVPFSKRSLFLSFFPVSGYASH